METTKIALLGFGTVGTGVWSIIKDNGFEIDQRTGAKIEIAKVLVRDRSKSRSIALPEDIVTTDFNDILSDKSIKLVVEVMGGLEPAREYIEKAIESGKHVVTANKLLISKHGSGLTAKAEACGKALSFEASVCGGIPIINAIRAGLASEKIEEIVGIVNGTSNYILSEMSATGCSFKDALGAAQEKGFAEADPTSDVEGYDAMYKIRILTKLAYGTDVSEGSIYREGISKISIEDINYAKELGYEIKLLAVSKAAGSSLDTRVHPALVPAAHSLARTGEAYNAVCVKGSAAGELFFYGKGAGELPTGSAVVSDIVNILRNNQDDYNTKVQEQSTQTRNIVDIRQQSFPYYIRMVIKKRPGALQEIINLLGENGIKIATMIRKEQASKYSTLVLLSYEAAEYNMQNAVKLLGSLPSVIQLGNTIRVVNFGEQKN